MLNESSLYTFIDADRKFALYFLEGQKLIQDLIVTHHQQKNGIEYLRSSVLSVQLMAGLLKKGEYFCFYIDSKKPAFNLKIETNTQDHIRGVLYSDKLKAEPENINGIGRLVKFLPETKAPHQSTIELDDVKLDEIMNLVLERSYQVSSRIKISEKSDQAFMLHQLPLGSQETPTNLDETWNDLSPKISAIMDQALTDKSKIQKAFSNIDYKYLADRPVKFHCSCSKEKFIESLITLAQSTAEEIFLPNEESIEVTCEYCKSSYQIQKNEVEIERPPEQ